YDVGYESSTNIGFQNWRPTGISSTGMESVKAEVSNSVWEWTTSLFDTNDDLVPTNLSTGCSTDFFVTKHHIAVCCVGHA
ncbi:hypothetical protein C8F04DRAFT_950074, partial [Mycena alexandri]